MSQMRHRCRQLRLWRPCSRRSCRQEQLSTTTSRSRACLEYTFRVETRTRTHTRTRTRTHARQHRITRGRDFFITVRADCIFLRLSTTGVSNLENRVEGGPSNHVFLAIVFRVDPGYPRAPRVTRRVLPSAYPHPWTQSSSRENEGPFIRRPWGRSGYRASLSLSLYPPFLSIFM